MNCLDQIKYKIKENGFMQYVRIVNELRKMDCENIDETISKLAADPSIHRIRYTNRFLEKYKTRDLYYYNPKKKRSRNR